MPKAAQTTSTAHLALLYSAPIRPVTLTLPTAGATLSAGPDAAVHIAATRFAHCEAALDEWEADDTVTDIEGNRICGAWDASVQAVAAIAPVTAMGLRVKASILLDVSRRLVDEHEQNQPEHILAEALCRDLLALPGGVA